MSEINVIPQNDNSGNNSLAMAIIAIVILGIGAYFAYANGWFRMQPTAVNPNPTTSNINVTIPTTPNPITTPTPTSNPIP